MLIFIVPAFAGALSIGPMLPVDQRCIIDVSIADSTQGGSTSTWRIAIRGSDTLAVNTSLPVGKRQAVLQSDEGTFFQTEGMARALRVGLAQRILGQISIADVIDPRQTVGWEVQAETATSVTATAKSGSGLAYSRAEFDRGSVGQHVGVTAARFYGPSGGLMRSVSYVWQGSVLAGVTLTDVSRPGVQTKVLVQPPKCDPSPMDVSSSHMLPVALSLLP